MSKKIIFFKSERLFKFKKCPGEPNILRVEKILDHLVNVWANVGSCRILPQFIYQNISFHSRTFQPRLLRLEKYLILSWFSSFPSYHLSPEPPLPFLFYFLLYVFVPYLHLSRTSILVSCFSILSFFSFNPPPSPFKLFYPFLLCKFPPSPILDLGLLLISFFPYAPPPPHFSFSSS